MKIILPKAILCMMFVTCTSCSFDELVGDSTIGIKHRLRMDFVWLPRALEFFPRYLEVQNLEFTIDDKSVPELPPFSDYLILGFYSVNKFDSISLSIGLPYSRSECQQNYINNYFDGIELNPDSLSAVLLLNLSTSRLDSVRMGRYIQLEIKPAWSTTRFSDFNFDLAFLNSLDSTYNRFNNGLIKLISLKRDNEFEEWKNEHEGTIKDLVSIVNQFAFYISASRKSSKRILELQLDMNKNYESTLVALSRNKTDTPLALLIQDLLNCVLALQNTINDIRNEWIKLLVVNLDMVYYFGIDDVPIRPVPWIFPFSFSFTYRLSCE